MIASIAIDFALNGCLRDYLTKTVKNNEIKTLKNYVCKIK